MKSLIPLLLLHGLLRTSALNLDYLDPTKLQTRTTTDVQEKAATDIITKYINNVRVTINPLLFKDKKDAFVLRTDGGYLYIKASTGVAAVWGFNYFLKKYCKSQIAWQTQRVSIPDPLPEVDEVVFANDRLRYYQNVCTASYSFVWWTVSDWMSHVEWMALNGINLALAPIAQEAAWINVYRQIGMTEEEIEDHFTGPAFLSWLRMGNVHGWGGPLPKSWHDRQKNIQDQVVTYMFQLGMIPVLPAFNGHVPKAFARIYPNATFYSVDTWNKFGSDYCCNLFLHPNNTEFQEIGTLFLKEITARTGLTHVYTADPFNEVKILPWSSSLVRDTAVAIYSTLTEVDDAAVWMIQNWMFVHNPLLWPIDRVKTFLTPVPNGRMLVIDLQSEQWPQYDLYQMYYGQPFIWSMLHNFGGTLGMFGNMNVINKDVYEVRSRVNSTMIGIGLTPEGINQNYVVYDLMLESAWRKRPVQNLETWVADYAERRYGCNSTASAWKYLLRSVYSFNGLNRMRGKYVITRRPSFKIQPWAWYSSNDLIKAFKKLLIISNDECLSDGYYYDVVDVTRQVLQYRAEQLYMKFDTDRFSDSWVFNSTINRFLDAMYDIETILATNTYFTASNWFSQAQSVGNKAADSYMYDLNARNQITLWGPNGEITDYACKQWAEMFEYYYIPRWRLFLSLALDANIKLNPLQFDERSAQRVVRSSVEEAFLSTPIDSLRSSNTIQTALKLYGKWAYVSDLDELPRKVIMPDKETTLPDTDIDGEDSGSSPTAIHLKMTTPK
ncbi:alpha-N-acetylglucosaminidase [Epargyreus clarus]|uniref:alpha-N-acetylglucosaminidase n=1 Tax=Epargyreus clarus TaxID=520877 RepID=UPI003C2EB628